MEQIYICSVSDLKQCKATQISFVKIELLVCLLILADLSAEPQFYIF